MSLSLSTSSEVVCLQSKVYNRLPYSKTMLHELLLPYMASTVRKSTALYLRPTLVTFSLEVGSIIPLVVRPPTVLLQSPEPNTVVFAFGLAKEGASVVLAARRLDALEGVKRKVSAYGGRVLVVKTDITKKEQVENLVSTASAQLGPVDILVSCAGVMYFTMMANVQTEEWDRTVDVNCKGLLNCLSSTVPGMLERGIGHIVAISSDAGRKVFPGLGVYSASKFFVEATLQALRLETAGSGLRVTSIQPGNTATELLGMSTDAEAIKKYGEPTGAKVLDAEDVASSIVYAVCQPEHVAVNEILIEPRDEPI